MANSNTGASTSDNSTSKIQDPSTKYRGIIFQVIGFTMMTLGLLLIILPFVFNMFNKKEKNPYTQEVNFSQIDNQDKNGEIDNQGINTFRVDASTLSAREKSDSNISRIQRTGHWSATNYAPGDIGVGNYEVRQGDTLWEISEAVYGNGNLWGRILDRNISDIGFLPNGQQALIHPGQILIIAK
ncbi:MAG: LysM peptidoglycan-binding domain-containing protein [bacterium]